MSYTTKIVAAAACLSMVFAIAGCGQLNPKTEGQIYSALEAKNKNFQKCYEKALTEDRNLQGKVQLKLEFSPDVTSPKKVTVERSTIQHKKMLKCVSKAADKIRIEDAPGVFVEGLYTVTFNYKK